jgi:hypothetical protein
MKGKLISFVTYAFQNPPLSSSSTGTGTLYMSLLARGAPTRFVFSILLRAADDPDV